jgi:methylase of polypeptide subunit release factors
LVENDAAADALVELLAALDEQEYAFVTPTPATHQRVIGRAAMTEACDLRGVFGWNLPFAREILPHRLLELLDRSGLLRQHGEKLKSGVRVSSMNGRLFLHSAFPTTAEDAVFFGPDSYRFVDFVRSELADAAGVQRLVDIGAGAGVGGIMAAPLVPGARISLIDTNPKALRIAGVNARHAAVDVELVEGEGIDAITGAVDLVIANPPYMIDESDRTYRDGGKMHGAALSLDWSLASARRLEPGGRMLLYTGVAIVDGRDALRDRLERELPELGCSLRYREIDPDVFGEDLVKPAYAEVERIAVVGAVIERAAN